MKCTLIVFILGSFIAGCSGVFYVFILIFSFFEKRASSLIAAKIVLVINYIYILISNISLRLILVSNATLNSPERPSVTNKQTIDIESEHFSSPIEHKSDSAPPFHTINPNNNREKLNKIRFILFSVICLNVIDVSVILGISAIFVSNRISPMLFFVLFSIIARIVELCIPVYICRYYLFPNFYGIVKSSGYSLPPIDTSSDNNSSKYSVFRVSPQNYFLKAYEKCIICDTEACSGKIRTCRKCMYIHPSYKKQELEEEKIFSGKNLINYSSRSISRENTRDHPSSSSSISLEEILKFDAKK